MVIIIGDSVAMETVGLSLSHMFTHVQDNITIVVVHSTWHTMEMKWYHLLVRVCWKQL